MQNFITSLIRTYVPIAVGAVISWLAFMGIDVDPAAQAGLIIFLTAVLQGVYYMLGRLIEQRFPRFGGLLLGSSKQPAYTPPALPGTPVTE